MNITLKTRRALYGEPIFAACEAPDGVCGAAAREQRTQLVKDVHEFAGHIACDAATNSELVIPLTIGDQRLGVLDLDSPKLARFSATDQAILEQLATKIATMIAN